MGKLAVACSLVLATSGATAGHLPANDPMNPGGIYSHEDHRFHNHSNEVLDNVVLINADLRNADLRSANLTCQALQTSKNLETAYRDPELACGVPIPDPPKEE